MRSPSDAASRRATLNLNLPLTLTITLEPPLRTARQPPFQPLRTPAQPSNSRPPETIVQVEGTKYD
jgi:hypothetical protein